MPPDGVSRQIEACSDNVTLRMGYDLIVNTKDNPPSMVHDSAGSPLAIPPRRFPHDMDDAYCLAEGCTLHR